MKKIILSLLILSLFFGIFAGNVAAQDDPSVGFVVKSLANEYWIIVRAGARNRAEELGVDLNFIAPNSESDISTQIQMIENLVGSGVDALSIAPSSPDAVQSTLDLAAEEGIKLLAVDTDFSHEAKLTFIGTGNKAAAKQGAEYAMEQLGSDVNAIVLRGRLGDETHDQREAGIVEGLEENGAEILEIQAADSEAERALNVTQNLLQRYFDVNLIIATNDGMAQGAQRAVEAANLTDQVSIMGFDGTVPVAEMTADGMFLGTVAQDPYKMGQLGVEKAVEAINGKEIEERIDSGVRIITPENALEYIEEIDEQLGN